MKKLIPLILLLPLCLWADPRNTSPLSPDDVYQNDLDLRDMVNSRVKNIDGELCLGNETLCVNTSSDVVTISVDQNTKPSFKMVGNGGGTLIGYINNIDGSGFGFDVDYNSGWIAKDGSSFIIYKAGDSLRIYGNSSLTPDAVYSPTIMWKLEPAYGAITQPGQPSFLALSTADQANATGDGTVVTVVFGTEVFDGGNNFASNTTFTAPVTGIYQLNASVRLDYMTAASVESIAMTIVTSNGNYIRMYESATTLDQSTYILSVSDLVDMDASDTAYVTIAAYGGTKTCRIGGGNTASRTTRFSGSLIN